MVNDGALHFWRYWKGLDWKSSFALLASFASLQIWCVASHIKASPAFPTFAHGKCCFGYRSNHCLLTALATSRIAISALQPWPQALRMASTAFCFNSIILVWTCCFAHLSTFLRKHHNGSLCYASTVFFAKARPSGSLFQVKWRRIAFWFFVIAVHSTFIAGQNLQVYFCPQKLSRPKSLKFQALFDMHIAKCTVESGGYVQSRAILLSIYLMRLNQETFSIVLKFSYKAEFFKAEKGSFLLSKKTNISPKLLGGAARILEDRGPWG